MESATIGLSPEKRKLLTADDKRTLAIKYNVGYAYVNAVVSGFRNNKEILTEALEIANKAESEKA